jgi:hypothetical protein
MVMSEQQIDYAWRCAQLLAENGTLKNNLAAATERAELAEKQRDAAVDAFDDLAGTIRGSRVSYCPTKIYTVRIEFDWLAKVTARIREMGEKGGE